MSRRFIKGMLAEKAKLANTLIAELAAEMPDELLWKYQDALQAGSTACHNIYADLRASDKSDDAVDQTPATTVSPSDSRRGDKPG